MGDSEDKRRRRDVLSKRLDSYYEKLMEVSVANPERWEMVLQEANAREAPAQQQR
jgi:hypothetical protein